MENKDHRPPIETLACPYSDCHLHARRAAGNLTVRKLYGKDQIRYLLRCRACAREFSERKNTALFNCKIEERKAVSVAEHLAEGVSTKAASRLVGVSAEAVRRLRRNLGEHARDFHDELVQDLEATHLGTDGRALWVCRLKEGAFVGSDCCHRAQEPPFDQLCCGKEGRVAHRSAYGVHQKEDRLSEESGAHE